MQSQVAGGWLWHLNSIELVLRFMGSIPVEVRAKGRPNIGNVHYLEIPHELH